MGASTPFKACRDFAKRVLAVLTLAAAATAHAQTPDAASAELTVSYIEGRASDSRVLAGHLHDYAKQLHSGPGTPSVEVFQERGRPNRVVVIERWSDPASAEAAGARLQAAVAGDLEAPMDRRPNKALTPMLAKPAPAGAFHMIMHVDVVPNGSAAAAQALMELSRAVAAAPGALGFEAATQEDKANHFLVHEVWTSRTAYDAFTASAAEVRFREQLTPFKGAPFADVFYAAEP